MIAITAASGIGRDAFAGEASTPKISKARAEMFALKLAPDKIMTSDYDNEGGGWRNLFDIERAAMSGKVVENKSQGKIDHH